MRKSESERQNRFVDEVSKTLIPGKTAVVAEVEETWQTPVDARLGKLGGLVFRRLRSEVVEDQLVRAVVERLLAALSRLAERGGAAAEPGVAAAPTDSDEALGFAMPGVRRYSLRSVLIETPEPVGATLDGEVRAQTPVLIHVAAEPLPVLLPSQARAALGSGG